VNTSRFECFCPKKSYHSTLFNDGAIRKWSVHVCSHLFSQTDTGELCDACFNLPESSFNLLQSVGCYHWWYSLNLQISFTFWITFLFWDGPSSCCYYWYHLHFYIPHVLYFCSSLYFKLFLVYITRLPLVTYHTERHSTSIKLLFFFIMPILLGYLLWRARLDCWVKALPQIQR
jgi:hypothetical protein